MADHVLECGLAEQRPCQDMQCVEPAPRLVDVLHDEVGREVLLEPLLVLERVMHLRKGHRTRFEPAVEHLRHAPHRRATCRVVGIGASQLVDERPVQVGGAHTEVSLQLVETAVDVDSWIVRVVAHPDRDGRAPKPVATDGPVTCPRQPLAEPAVAHMAGHPVDLLVGLGQQIRDLGDFDVPRADGLVDDRRVGAPAVRVVVLVAVVTQHPSALAELGDDLLICLEHVEVGPRRHRLGEATPVIDWHGIADLDAVGLAEGLILLAEAGSEVNHAGAFRRVYEVAGKHPERLGAMAEEVKHRLVAAACQFSAAQCADHCVRLEIRGVVLEAVSRNDVASAAERTRFDDRIGDFCSDGDRQVRRECPWRRRPSEQAKRARCAVCAGGVTCIVKLEPDRDGGILTGPRGIVEPDLKVGQRRLCAPGVRHDTERLVHEAAIPELLEGPHDRFHVGQIHCLVVVVEVHPSCLAGDGLAPLGRVAQHRFATSGVEAFDAEFGDRSSPAHAELALGLHFCGQAMTVPPETPIHAMTPHRLIAGDDVLDVPSQQVAVVGQPVREWRTVVEDIFIVRGPVGDGCFEGSLILPTREDPLLDVREIRLRRHARVHGVDRLSLHQRLLRALSSSHRRCGSTREPAHETARVPLRHGNRRSHHPPTAPGNDDLDCRVASEGRGHGYCEEGFRPQGCREEGSRAQEICQFLRGRDRCEKSRRCQHCTQEEGGAAP